jgi:hypothetical protein
MTFEKLQSQLEQQNDDSLLAEIRDGLINAHGAMKENLREALQELMLMISAAVGVDNVYSATRYRELVLSSLKALSALEGTHA